MFVLKQDAIQSLFIQSKYCRAGENDLARLGGHRDASTNEKTFSFEPRTGWCPSCLLEDRARGGDHFLRLDWALAGTTMCLTHRRPLNGRCGACYRHFPHPECTLYGQRAVFICPLCNAPFDGQHGIDYVSEGDISDLEEFMKRQLKRSDRDTKKGRAVGAIIGIANLLLFAGQLSFQKNRPIDYFQSGSFSAPDSLGIASRNLPKPFAFAHLVERRKVLAFIIALLNDDLEGFGFVSGSGISRELRDTMDPEMYEVYQRRILDLARLSIPVN